MSKNRKFSSVPKEKVADYKFSLELYPDTTDYDCGEVLKKLTKFFLEYAWILHDKDHVEQSSSQLRRFVGCRNRLKNTGVLVKPERKYKELKKPHIHFYGRMNNHCKISIKQLVKYLEMPANYTERREIAFAYDWQACLYYTIHFNQPGKYQYRFEDVVTNIPRFRDYFRVKRSMLMDLQVLQDILAQSVAESRHMSYFEIVDEMTLNGCTLQLNRSSFVEKYIQSYQRKFQQAPVD